MVLLTRTIPLAALTTARASNTFNITVDALSILKSVTITAVSGSPRRQTWAVLYLQKTDATIITQLCSGYIDVNDNSVSGNGNIQVDPSMRLQLVAYSSVAATLTLVVTVETEVVPVERRVWFGKQEKSTDGQGAIRAITSTAPAAGAEVSESVPTGARWKFLSARIELTTGAAVANRAITVVLDNGTDFIYRSIPSAAITASQTKGVLPSIGFPFSDVAAFDSNGYSRIFLPIANLLKAADRWRTITAALQAADTYAALPYIVEEWLEP